MKSENVSIAVSDDDCVSAVVSAPDKYNENSGTGLIFAHGAANDMHHPSIAAVAEGLAETGYITLRFNFPYREKGRKSPDPEHRLVYAWQRAIAFFRNGASQECNRIIAVGKSLGGRIAAQAVSEGKIDPAALIFLGYPLHAPGKKERLRDAHLYKIDVPMLFFEGTRDPFCDLGKLEGVFEKLSCPRELEIIEGADHSFNLPKADPRSHMEVHRQVVDRCRGWLQSL